MTKLETIQKRISEDRDYVHLKRFDYSLDKVLDRYPDGVPSRVIAQGLMLTEEEIEEALESAILKIRKALRIEVDS